MNTQEILHAISFAFVIVFPNLALMALGFFMRRRAIIDANFVDVASKIVFNFGLPCLLFFSVLKSNIDIGEQATLLTAGVLTTFALFFGAEVYAKLFVPDVRDKGVFVQGVFRSNMAILALSIVTSAYGEAGSGVGAVYMGVLTIVYNILSIITLSRTQQNNTLANQGKEVIKRVFTNPLTLSLFTAFAYKGLGLSLPPQPITKTGELLAAIALPLALICAGATLDVRSMLNLSGVSMQASIGRIIVAPLVAVAMGVAFSLPPVHFGVLFIMVASPAAAASYVMAKAMGGNDIVAANILAFTTVVSMIGMAIGMAWLRVVGLV